MLKQLLSAPTPASRQLMSQTENGVDQSTSLGPIKSVKVEDLNPSPSSSVDEGGKTGEVGLAGHNQENNNSICRAAAHFEEQAFDAADPSLAGHISTAFNVLECETEQQWNYTESKQDLYYGPGPMYYQQPVPPSHYPQYVMTNNMVQCQIPSVETQGPMDYGSYEPAEKRRKSTPGLGSARHCQMEYTDNFRRFINIPSTSSLNSAPATNTSADSGVQSPDTATMDECEAEAAGLMGGAVMCPACKNVYSSPRSLTGHIGRTEKCREAIGRDYLEDIMRRGEPGGGIPEALAAAADGISPVCPHCNRFISHYKGNIRRHVNACRHALLRKDSVCSMSGGAPDPPFYEPPPTNASTGTSSNPSAMSASSGLLDEHQHQACSSVASSSSLTAKSEPTIHELQPLPPGAPHPYAMYQPPHQLPPPPASHHLPPMPAYLEEMPHHAGMPVPPPPHHHHHHHHLAHHQPPPQHLAYVDYLPYEPMAGMPVPPPYHHPMYMELPPQPQRPHLNHSPPHAGPMHGGNAEPTPPKPKPPKHNGMVTPDDPYVCSWCTFNTVYKGNMKRHLISCHNCNDELLRKYSFDLERLRKSAVCRAGPDALPFIEVRPAQPAGARRPRANAAGQGGAGGKSMGRPKKSNSLDKEKAGGAHPAAEPAALPPMAFAEPPLLHYSVVPPPTTLDHMQFMPAPAPVMHAPNAYVIKDCGNDSGLGLVDEFHDPILQPAPLPGY